jgi:hypothetical protein
MAAGYRRTYRQRRHVDKNGKTFTTHRAEVPTVAMDGNVATVLAPNVAGI